MILHTYSVFRGWFATSATKDAAGYEVWPVASVRANGFSTLQSLLPTDNPADPDGTGPLEAPPLFPIYLTINGGAADAVPGTHEYDWYLSQNTDDPAAQLLMLTQPLANKSGSVRIDRSALGLTLIGASPNTDEQIVAFRNVTLYVQRRSDNAIDVGDFYRAMLSTTV